MRFVYVAGPYTGKTYHEISRNIVAAEEAAVALSNAGVGFFCPHTHTAHFEAFGKASEEFYKQLDEHFLSCCEALLLLDGWTNSAGSRREFDIMREQHKPVFNSVEDVIEWATR